jgi:diguanylate cyclase
VQATDKENWRRKYLDSLRDVDRDERRFRDQLQVLYKLVGRLCVAAQGQSPRLDQELKRLKDAVRGDPTPEVLEPLGQAVTDAILEIDHGTATLVGLRIAPGTLTAPPESATAGAPKSGGEALIRNVLSRLLAELRADPQLAGNIEPITGELARPLTTDQLPPLVERVGGLVVQRINGLERVRQELELLLGQMVGQLDALTQYVEVNARDESHRSDSNSELNLQITGDIRALDESAANGSDLTTIRGQLRQRLDSIGRHLQSFKDREAERAQQARERTEQMRGRMDELESEARKLQARLADEKRLSMVDTLTQVPNRLAYDLRIGEELERWKRFAQPTCLAVWDIDLFKVVNDTYGHRAGDKVLTVVADCLAKAIRSTDFVARYGGEEFVLLLPGTSLDDGLRLVNKIREAVAQLGLHCRGTPVQITISCGITAFKPDDAVGDAFERADTAMYRAKQAGRNCVVNA